WTPRIAQRNAIMARPAVRCASALARALPEQDALFLLAHHLLAGRTHLVGPCIGTLRRGARRDRGLPASYLGKRREVDRRLVVGTDPRIARHVRDRVLVAGNEAAALEATVEHAEQALGLLGVALDRIRDLLRCIHVEMPVLARHRPESAHLPEEPFVDPHATAQVLQQEPPGLVGEVE